MTLLAALLLALSPAPPAFTPDDAAPPPEPVTVDCSAETPRGCTERVYAALWTETLTLGEVAAMTARAELGLFFDLGYGDVASEAFWRSWFDVQSGACRPECSYGNLIDYLTTSQVWRDSYGNAGVNLSRLTVDDDRLHIFGDRLAERLKSYPDWQTGQGAAFASTWGNQRLEPGAVDYPASDEVFAVVIVHHYADGYSFDADVRADEIPACSLASLIVSTEGRLAQGVSTCNG